MAKLPVKREKGTCCGFCAPIELGLSDNQMANLALQLGLGLKSLPAPGSGQVLHPWRRKVK